MKCSCTNESLGTNGLSATNSHMAAGKVGQPLCPSGFARDDGKKKKEMNIAF